MADWSYGVNDAATVKLWSARLFKQSITRTIAWRLANISSSVSSEENIVQILDDTQKGPGDNITYDLISKLNAPGVIGDDTLYRIGTYDDQTGFFQPLEIREHVCDVITLVQPIPTPLFPKENA